MNKWVNYYSCYYASQYSAGILAAPNRSEWVEVWFYYWSWINSYSNLDALSTLPTFLEARRSKSNPKVMEHATSRHTTPPIPKPGTMNSTAERHARTCAWSLSLVQPEHLSWEGCRIPYIPLPVNFYSFRTYYWCHTQLVLVTYFTELCMAHHT